MSVDRDEAAAVTLARAEMLLSILSQQAVAARAEAQCAELRLLLAEAQSGTHLRLQQWLDQHSHGVAQPREYLDHPQQSGIPGRPAQLPPNPVHTIANWDQLLPFARERLRQHQQLFHTASEQAAADKLAEISTPSYLAPQPLQRSKQQASRPLHGLALSFGAHLAIIALLALITLRMPSPPASLALESATTELSSQPIEISEPLAVDTPQDNSQLPAADNTFDIADNFDEVTATARTALSDFSGQTQSLSTVATLASATSASSALANALNADASFFGSAASGNSFCYVIDGSGSMRGGPWEAAKQELFKSLSSLKEKQRFYIIFFNRELYAIPFPGEREPAPRTLYATAENLAHAHNWIETLRIDIGGPPNAALELAISKEPDAIYLLTDGVTQVDVLGFLRKKNRLQDLIFGEQVRVPIHTIAFYSLAGQELLKQIAADNKGQYIYVPDPRKR